MIIASANNNEKEEKMKKKNSRQISTGNESNQSFIVGGDITDDMGVILNYLYRKRRFKEDRSWPHEKIVYDLGVKVEGDIEKIIQKMVNLGLLGQLLKKGRKRHWVKAGETKRILLSKGYLV